MTNEQVFRNVCPNEPVMKKVITIRLLKAFDIADKAFASNQLISDCDSISELLPCEEREPRETSLTVNYCLDRGS